MEARLQICGKEIWGAFYSTKNSRISGWGGEWNRHFPEFHSETVPLIPGSRNNRKIPFHSTIPARASFFRAWKSKFNMVDAQASKHIILVLYMTKD